MSELPAKPPGSRPYLPPPPDDGSPESVEVPRMEPPPPSLEAMVRSRPGSPLPARSSYWGWIALIVIVVAAIAYYLEIYRPR